MERLLQIEQQTSEEEEESARKFELILAA